ncbi:MAG: response regulator transcription factor [Pseudomonadales bacterium]
MNSANKIQQTVYVVDDDEAVLDALALLLDTVGLNCQTFCSANAFLDAYDGVSRGCLVLDIRMPGMSGLELQEKLVEKDVLLPIIFITGHGDIPMAVEAMRSGAHDFIRKPFREQELLDRINEALALESGIRHQQFERSAIVLKLKTLTDREREVFERITAGEANKVIAIELEISERTVEVHRAHVMKKMAAKSLAQLVRMKIIAEMSPT